jgi:FdhD protein
LRRSYDMESGKLGRREAVHSAGLRPYEGALIVEEPLVIRVEGRSYAVIMRTPGEEIAHAAGFCLAEGLIDSLDDLGTVGYCADAKEGNVMTVTLKPERRREVQGLLERRGFVSQTSCGICGKELIKDLCQVLKPNSDKTKLTAEQVASCAGSLPAHQGLYQSTGSSHCAVLFDRKGKVLAAGEDVGRHNALDKAIGKALTAGCLGDACLGVLSSRISYELVQKAARARLPILIALSRATTLAVELGRKMNMTLAWMSRKDGIFVFCGEERLR